MRAARIFYYLLFTFCLSTIARAQEERRVSFNLFGGIALLPGSERINNSGQAENIFGGYPIAPMGGLGVNYRFSEKLALANNVFFMTTNKAHFSFHTVGLRSAVKYFPLTDKHRLSPFISGGLNLNLVSIDRRKYSETFFPDTNSAVLGGGISVAQIDYNYEKLNLSFIPMPGVSAGAGISYKLTPKLSVFAEYNYNYNLANLSSLMKQHYFNNKANLAYHFASAGITFKLLKPRKQLLATLPREAWDGDLTVSVKGSLVYKNPKKKSDKVQTIEIDDKRDTVIAQLPADKVGDFLYNNLRVDDYKFYLLRNNRKIERADLQIIHDNRKVDIFEDYPELELIDDYESSNLISRDNNFSVILREGFQHEVDITVIANNVIGKVTPFSSDTLCRNMLVLLKNKKDSVLAVTKPDNDCGYHFDDVAPGQYTVVFVRDSMPGDVHFSYEFTDNVPEIKRQYNTDEDELFYDLYASAEMPEQYEPIDLNEILLYDRVEQEKVIASGNVPHSTTGVVNGMNSNMNNHPIEEGGKFNTNTNTNTNNKESSDSNTDAINNELKVTDTGENYSQENLKDPLSGDATFTKTTNEGKNESLDSTSGELNVNSANESNKELKDSNTVSENVAGENLILNNNTSNTNNDQLELDESKFYPLTELRPGYSYSPEGQVKHPGGYGVQVAAFKSVENLKKFLAKEKKITDKPIYIQVISEGENSYHVKLYRVVVGEYPDMEAAEKVQKELQEGGQETVIRKHKMTRSRGSNY